ncbi:MAG: RNA polymerase sigma factor [Solirubrobacteraceae bacterium]
MAADAAGIGTRPARAAPRARRPPPVRGESGSGGDPRRRSPPAPSAVETRAGGVSGRAETDVRRLDGKSRAWLDALRSTRRRDEAIRSLHALLLREAQFEVARRGASLIHPSGVDLDDLAVQAADDAVVSILAKLNQFRGESLFTTWARRFVQREAPAKLRCDRRRTRELPLELELECPRLWPIGDESPFERIAAKESVRTLARLIAQALTARQREVLIALAIEGARPEDLARRLGTSTGALYKTLHEARRKLGAELAEAE